MNQHHKWENFWLFTRDNRQEITNLVMMQGENVDTPRLHNSTLLQMLMIQKMETIMKIQGYQDPEEVLPPSARSKAFRACFSLAKAQSIVKTKEEAGTVPISSNLEVIPHANDKSNKR